ncbi:MAG: lycopene cyclase domain-containing protein [Candidatus Dojkabacteria bacterium]
MEFFVLSLILIVINFILLLFRRDLIRESLMGSLTLLPFAFFEMFFIPYYWNPHSVGQFAFGPLNFDLEAFFCCIAVGGIASISYEIFRNKKIKDFKGIYLNQRDIFIRNFAIIIVVIISIIFGVFLRPYFIYSFLIVGPVGFFIITQKRKDLFLNGIVGGLIFTLIYIISLWITAHVLYPGWIDFAWNKQNLILNSSFLGIPLEEYLWAFTTGILWAPAYEYLTNRKEVNA